MSILDNLPHTYVAKKRTRVKDSVGGSKDSFATVSSGTCWCQQAGDSESEGMGQRGMTESEKVYFTSDPGLDETHVLLIKDNDGVDVGTFYVRSRPLIDASAGLGILWRVMVDRNTTDLVL